MTIRELMTRDPVFCTPDENVVECARLMERHDVGMIPVVESKETRRLVGVVTDRDLCLEVIAGARIPDEVVVEECMTDELFTVSENDPLERALEIMQHEQVRRLPVIDASGALIGVVAQADIAGAASPAQLKSTVEEISRPVAD